MKFKYYIIDLQEGAVTGTASDKVAKEFSQSDDFFVVDSEIGQWLMDDHNKVEIKEQRTYDLPEPQAEDN